MIARHRRHHGIWTFSRERLHARMDLALRSPVALVIAEAELGKTTFVRDYLALRGVPHVRFAAAPQHRDAVELARDLAHALGVTQPPLSPSAADAQSWARCHLAGRATTIVLDELHHALAEPRAAAFVHALVDAEVPELRWVLCAREAAYLPVPRWLATGMAELPIESDDLRVTHAEVLEAAGNLGLEADAPALIALTDRLGGWPLGIGVALATADISASPDRTATYDRLADHVLPEFAPRDRIRVLETACCERFDLPLLATLECAPALAARLVESGLAFAIDERAHHYAFHPPLLARLRLRIDALPLDERGGIFGRAAGALERVGRWSEAIGLRIAAGDAGALVETLADQGFSALDRGDVATVRRALAALSDDSLLHRPLALAMKAAVASLDESFDVSEAWFRMAMDAAADADRRDIVIRYGMDLVRRGRSDVVDVLEAEVARTDTRSSADTDAALWALLGTAYVEAHRLDDAREAARRALLRLPAMKDDGLRARVLHQASYVALNDADWDGARDLAQRALARADDTRLYDLSARALSVLFNVAILHDDDVPEARRALVRLEDAGRRASADRLRLYAILNAYALEVDAGDARALERLDAQLQEMQLLITPTVSEALLPAQALRAAWDGRFGHAYDLLAPGAEKLFDDDRTAYRCAEIAVYAAAAGKLGESADAVRRSTERLSRIDEGQPLALRSSAYLAIAHLLAGNLDDARRLIAGTRTKAGSAGARLTALFDTVSALHASCGTAAADAVLILEDAIDALESVDLGGVARFIGMLPLTALDGPMQAGFTELAS